MATCKRCEGRGTISAVMMAMRDPKEWASWIIAKSPLNEAFDEDFFARLIREAQEDGARHAACPHCGPGTDLNTALNQLADERVAVGWAKEAAARLEAQVAALTERAERAEARAKMSEQERDEMLRDITGDRC